MFPRGVGDAELTAQTAAGSGVLRIRVLDTVFRLQPRYAETGEMLRRQWSRCLVPGEADPTDTPYELPDENPPLPIQFGHNHATDMTIRGVRNLAGHRVMLHAAGLANEAGEVVALVGASGAGKSTASRALAASAFGYVTDETLAIDEDGYVLPYPKPLALIDPDLPWAKHQFGPDELGLRVAPNDLRLARLVLLDRSSGQPTSPSLSPVPMLEAVLELLPQTSATASLDGPLQRLCRMVERCGGVDRLTYSEIGTAATTLARLLADKRSIPMDWEVIKPDGPPAGRGGLLRRAPYLDAVRIGDEGLLLLEDRRPAHLSALALTLWLASDGGASENDLIRAAEALHGHHPDARAIIRESLSSMVEAGVLETSRRRD